MISLPSQYGHRRFHPHQMAPVLRSRGNRKKPSHPKKPTPTPTRTPTRTPRTSQIPRTRLTYRVRGVPLDWNKSLLQSFLGSLPPHVGDAPNSGLTTCNTRIGSLATEIHGRSLTATVAFQTRGTVSLEGSLLDSGQSNPPIALDHHFLGITTLYTPSKDHHEVDIIAISGLGGHTFGSFKQRGGEHMWLRDALPRGITGEDGDTPCARAMVYGYDSMLQGSQSTQNIEDLAISLNNSLLQLTNLSATPKPIVFIAHSLGGLIVKQALIFLSKSTRDHDQRLFGAVYGIVFFGVPHDGMDIKSLVPMVGDGPNRFFLESIGNISSQVLSSQQEEFPKAFGNGDNSEIVCFYETRKSPTAIQVWFIPYTLYNMSHPSSLTYSSQVDGEWKMGGPEAVLVSKSSATHCRPWESGPDYICPLDRSHSNMVKFAPHDHEYDDKVLPRIQAVVRRALVIRHPTLSPSAQRCLQSLGFPEIDVRFKDIDPAVEGTCKWLLAHEMYKSWASSSQGLLWIRGKPGSGKSTLLKYALAHITGTKTGDTWNRALILSFFFHGRGAELQRTPLGLYQSLVCQILQQVPDALKAFVDTFERKEQIDKKKQPVKKQEWHPKELWEALKSSLPIVLQKRSVWLFIDALDEAGDEYANDVLGKIKSLVEGLGTIERSKSAPRPFRLCFTCREYPVLEEDFKNFINPTAQNQGDISTFVKTRLSESRLSRSNIPELIAGRADGIFMWARLVVDRALSMFRGGESLARIERMVQSTPPELDELYQILLEGLKPDERPASLKLMQWTCCSFQPLALDQLRWAMIIDADFRHDSLEEYEKEEDFTQDNDAMERRVTTLSRGLVEVVLSSDKRMVQFIHQSAKDFVVEKGLKLLTSTAAETLEADVIGVAHYQLSRTCIRYLSMEEIGQTFADAPWDCDPFEFLGVDDFFNPDSMFNRDYAEFPLLHYATTSWVSHVQQSEERNVPQEDLLDYFAWPSNHLLHRWSVLKGRLPGTFYEHPTTLLHVVSGHQLMGPLRAILHSIGQFNVDINARDFGGGTPLCWAAQGGREAAIQELLNQGANIEARNAYGLTALTCAVLSGRENAIQVLLDRGAKIEARDGGGQTPLMHGASNGQRDALQILLDRGAEIEARDKVGETPLMHAACHRQIDALQILLDRGAEIEARDNDGKTPLAHAAKWGIVGAIQRLLDRGAEIEAKDNDGQTPLAHAAEYGSVDAVQILLDRGAEIEARDKRGRTPLSIAAVSHKLWPLAVEVQHIQALLDRGADLETKDDEGRTPLLRAAAKGYDEIMRLLLDRGADIEAKDNKGLAIAFIAGWCKTSARSNSAGATCTRPGS
ncbi:hypothetical protein F5144DRAFT_406716 [Chaetomium tenue]|uniref:Uncharacterized protein n=1 Tax=Chaetomium tenue TaxID=1854479 RepID=A0ACB7NW53_9PEZI|nr:hypothetical protein F5144DRAFT_406716 [Chaetomium globosum]